MPALQPSAASAPEANFRLPDAVYALRGAAYAECVGLAGAAQGDVAGDIAGGECAGQGCCARIGVGRAELVHAAICRSSRTQPAQARAGGYAGIVKFPAFRVDAMLAVLVACGAGYSMRVDLLLACGLPLRGAEAALRDCFAQGLLERDASLSPDACMPTQAGIEALRDAQGVAV